MQEQGKNEKNTAGLNKLCDKINSFATKTDAHKSRFPEWTVLLLYVICHCIISMMHEASFDEAHAWNIAKDAGVFEAIFEVPHWEGHPSLWHLILMPFAKAGLEYQISMTFVTLIFSGVAVYLLVFKSPFPRIIRLVLPFTYFFFYQYGVVARPYVMMMTAFMIAALTYKEKDRQPGKFVLSLIFLCATSAFGVAFCAGIAGSWLIEIIKEYYRKKSACTENVFYRDKRLWFLLLLLVYAIFLLCRAWPRNENGAMNYNSSVRVNGAGIRSIYLFLGLFADLFFTNTYNQDYLADFYFPTNELIICFVVGAIVLGIFIVIAKKYGTLIEFILPYVFFSVFSVFVYFCVYNSGLPLLFIVFWAWITMQRQEQCDPVAAGYKLVGIGRYLVPLGIAGMLLPLVWNFTASVKDVGDAYTTGKREAEFLIEKGLDKYDICVEWTYSTVDGDEKNLKFEDPKHNLVMDRLAAYIGHPNFVNWPFDDSLYVRYNLVMPEEERSAIIENLKNNPRPSVLIGEPKLEMLNDEDFVLYDEYEEVFRGTTNKTWKGVGSLGRSSILVRKDLL